MTTPNRDEEIIRSALQELRSADEAAAPELDDVLERQRPASRLDTRRVAALALAASVMVVCATTIARIALRPPRLVVSHEVMALTSWRPITDVLLEGPQRSVLSEMPRLGESFLPVTRIDIAKE